MRQARDGADIAVIGAGVVGCAVAARLAASGREVVVLEQHQREGAGVTARNSGVIHAGLYDRPGSLRARTCLRGRALLVAWCRARGIPHAVTGKLVVAHDEPGRAAIEALADNARACGAHGGLELWRGDRAARFEPHMARPVAALWSPHSGVVDPHALTASLRAQAERDGATFVTQARVTGARAGARRQLLETSRGPLWATTVVNCAGLEADRLARLVHPSAPRIHPCRGDYFRLRRPPPLRCLVYPARTPGQVGLGLHLTLDLAGGVRVGPDAQFVADRDALGPAEHKHPRFLAAARRLLGPVAEDDLIYDGCGIRPKLRAPGEAAERDFMLLPRPAGWLHLLGIESPGLTAALALAEEADRRLPTP